MKLYFGQYGFALTFDNHATKQMFFTRGNGTICLLVLDASTGALVWYEVVLGDGDRGVHCLFNDSAAFLCVEKIINQEYNISELNWYRVKLESSLR